jgi:phage shock protein PspC (stress-responsive transcriptional regulator)
MNTTPESPFNSDQPTWGSPSTPPAGNGSDFGPTGAQPGRPTEPGRPGARFFDSIRSLGVVRPDSGRWAAGVAAGIARRWNVDPVVVRIAFVVLTFFGGLGVALYGLGWLLLPHPDGRIHAQEVLKGTVTAGFIGAVLLLLCTTHAHGPLLPLALIALVIWKIGSRRPHVAS